MCWNLNECRKNTSNEQKLVVIINDGKKSVFSELLVNISRKGCCLAHIHGKTMDFRKAIATVVRVVFSEPDVFIES